MVMLQELYQILSKQRFPLENEKQLQLQIKDVLDSNKIAHRREFHLNDDNIIDFLIGGIGIEVKIKGNKKAIFRQCERYCEFEAISSLILLTSKSMGMLEEINNKPVYVINISRAWL